MIKEHHDGQPVSDHKIWMFKPEIKRASHAHVPINHLPILGQFYFKWLTTRPLILS